jgi:hypothetical protein
VIPWTYSYTTSDGDTKIIRYIMDLLYISNVFLNVSGASEPRVNVLESTGKN